MPSPRLAGVVEDSQGQADGRRYGRNYYCRYDYEGVESEKADAMIAKMAAETAINVGCARAWRLFVCLIDCLFLCVCACKEFQAVSTAGGVGTPTGRSRWQRQTSLSTTTPSTTLFRRTRSDSCCAPCMRAVRRTRSTLHTHRHAHTDACPHASQRASLPLCRASASS